MGDLITNSTDKEIFYIKKKYFDIVQKSKSLSNTQKFHILKYYHRINILFMVMNAGSGHIGTSFSIIDFLIIFELNRKRNSYIFSSKGHDSPAFYSIEIMKNKIEFKKIFKFRSLNGLPGHPDKKLKIFKFNTGSLGMGISKAKGYLRTTKNEKVFVILGDGELQEGQIWESINAKISSDLKIIIDMNELQSDFFTKNTSDIGNIKKKLQAFRLRVKTIDGHSYHQVSETLRSIDNYDCIILKTVKGKGVYDFEGNKKIYSKKNYPFHSGAPQYEAYIKAINEIRNKINKFITKDTLFKLEKYINSDVKKNINNQVSLINMYGNFICDKFQKNKKLVCLDADLAIDHGILTIKDKYPKRFIECGIAEMDMISQASGISENGKIPVCHSFSCFMSFRALEQIYNNCSEKRKIIYTASLIGVVPAGPGHSHQAVKDFSNYGTIPNLIVTEPINRTNLEDLYKVFKNEKNSMFIRLNPLPTINFQELNIKKSKFEPIVLKNWGIRNKKKKILILTYGSVLSEQVLLSSKNITKHNIKILTLIYLNRFNLQFFKKEIEKADKIVFFDNQISGLTPFTLLVSELNLKLNFYFKYNSFSIDGFPKCGKNSEILDYYNFSSKKISSKLNKL